ncbi:MAG: hypothetical protein D6732_15170 [Methanobacteriota archaeon]|nr:MAG: hypothetical protein D6732_15170 [Euryarchaeota archaeon]
MITLDLLVVINLNMVQTSFTCKICGMEVSFSIQDPSTYISKKDHDSFFGMSLQSFRVEHTIDEERHVNSIIVDAKGLYRGHLDAYAERLVLEDVSGFYLEPVEETSDLQRHPFLFFYLYDITSRMVLQFIAAEGMNLNVLLEHVLKKIHEVQQLYESKNSFAVDFADLKIQVILDNQYALIFAVDEPNDRLQQSLENVLAKYSSEGFIQLSSLILLLHIVTRNETVDFSALEKLLRTDLIRVKVKTELTNYIPKITEKITREFDLDGANVKSILMGEETVYDLILREPQKYIELGKMVEFTNRRKLLG